MARVSIPGYTIERELGSGGMAKVYLAIQHSLERKVALKVMSPLLAADESFSKRFLREARTIAGLTHPNIVAIYEVGVTVDNLHFFAMQHLPGGDFATRMRAGVTEDELRRVLGGIARALGFAHERGFVHRDVTPANILFDPTGNPVLTDFGIARAVGGSTRITHTGVSIGTSIYMSPEQARGAEVDARSDLYSLGVLTYEALTGEVPYKGTDSFAVAYAHVFEPIPRLPASAAHWQPLIDRALAKDPRERFDSAEAFCNALGQLAGRADSEATQPMRQLPQAERGRDLVRPPAVTQLVRAVGDRLRGDEAGSRRAGRWALLALGVVAVLALAWGGYTQWRQPAAPTLPSQAQSTPAPAPVAAAAAPPAEPLAPPDLASEAGAPVDAAGLAALAAAGYPAEVAEAEQQPARDGPPSQRAQLASWARAAERATAELRLLTPAGSSAVDFHRWALEIDAQDSAALAGLGAVVERYLGLADAARNEARLDDARSLIERARQVAALHPDPAPLQQRIGETESGWTSVLIGRAEGALDAWDREAALAALQEASQLTPEDPRIEALRSRADGLLQAGFRFQDRLSGGQLAPEMIVVAPASVMLSGARDGRRVAAAEPFAVARTEITRAQFASFVSASGRQVDGGCRNRENTGLFGATKGSRDWRNPDIEQRDDHPVVCVSFDDAEAYVRWLSQQTGRAYRLLSEAEWQGLAAAVPAEGRCRVANLADRSQGGRGVFDCDDGFQGTAPVAQLAATAGLYDIDGNVREWVQDCGNDSHAGHPGTQAARLNGDCGERMAMGRAWHSDSSERTVVQRQAFKRDVRSNTIGFRIAMTLPGGPAR